MCGALFQMYMVYTQGSKINDVSVLPFASTLKRSATQGNSSSATGPSNGGTNSTGVPNIWEWKEINQESENDWKPKASKDGDRRRCLNTDTVNLKRSEKNNIRCRNFKWCIVLVGLNTHQAYCNSILLHDLEHKTDQQIRLIWIYIVIRISPLHLLKFQAMHLFH